MAAMQLDELIGRGPEPFLAWLEEKAATQPDTTFNPHVGLICVDAGNVCPLAVYAEDSGIQSGAILVTYGCDFGNGGYSPYKRFLIPAWASVVQVAFSRLSDVKNNRTISVQEALAVAKETLMPYCNQLQNNLIHGPAAVGG